MRANRRKIGSNRVYFSLCGYAVQNLLYYVQRIFAYMKNKAVNLHRKSKYKRLW